MLFAFSRKRLAVQAVSILQGEETQGSFHRYSEVHDEVDAIGAKA